ncbi:MAG: hypothetical protein KF852_04585 [Saprospiraceae bacterium]|nr:hypothetical protein [Saprospiraceae bacterium]
MKSTVFNNRLLLWVFLLCSSGTTEIYGQAGLFDNLWLFGKRSTPFDPRIGGSQIDFSVSPPDTSTVEIPGNLDLLQMAVACDSSGRLIAYTNGCSIVDHTHQIMAGGDTINPGPYFLSNCVTYWRLCSGAKFAVLAIAQRRQHLLPVSFALLRQ